MQGGDTRGREHLEAEGSRTVGHDGGRAPGRNACRDAGDRLIRDRKQQQVDTGCGRETSSATPEKVPDLDAGSRKGAAKDRPHAQVR